MRHLTRRFAVGVLFFSFCFYLVFDPLSPAGRSCSPHGRAAERAIWKKHRGKKYRPGKKGGELAPENVLGASTCVCVYLVYCASLLVNGGPSFPPVKGRSSPWSQSKEKKKPRKPMQKTCKKQPLDSHVFNFSSLRAQAHRLRKRWRKVGAQSSLHSGRVRHEK